eukprot:7039917-Alexandrium_andersonii.AAC.1
MRVQAFRRHWHLEQGARQSIREVAQILREAQHPGFTDSPLRHVRWWRGERSEGLWKGEGMQFGPISLLAHNLAQLGVQLDPDFRLMREQEDFGSL